MELFSRHKRKLERLIDIIIILLIIGWIIFLFAVDLEKIIENIGVHNGYLLAFTSSFFGGLVTVTFASVYPTIIAFALGGLNPIILGIIAAIGLTIANMIYFYLGRKSRVVAEYSSTFDKYSHRILKWINSKPNWLIPILIWIYVGLSPFPNNLLTTSSGLIDFSYKKIIIPLFLGNITLMTILAYFGVLFD
ncbi:hypothetical protein KJ742_03280 [Patescibacteria group bacterium]|nr:hypothetical protein [Patescibacteria group bacterium]MBU1935688.1 hypothetical protein [Patescibacteria group bacterium]